MEETKHNETTEHIPMRDKNGTKHFFATIGSETEHSGRATVVISMGTVAGHRLERVGDVDLYRDASKAAIVDRAGTAAVNVNRLDALVGCRLSNGDRIIGRLQDRARLFDSSYVAQRHSAGAV